MGRIGDDAGWRRDRLTIALLAFLWGGEARAEEAPLSPSMVEREAAATARAAQERYDAGDFDAAITLWSGLLEGLPRTASQAPRRASVVLAIAGALERAYDEQRDPMRLRAAIDLLDAYLGDLDPADDENRGLVEARRRALAARLEGAATAPTAAAGDDGGPRRAAEAPLDLEAQGRRRVVVGGVLGSLGVGGLVVMGVGLALGEQADLDLAAAVARPVVEPGRRAAIVAAQARGIDGNRLAWSGGVIGGALAVAGAALLVQGRRLQVSVRASASAVVLSGAF